MDLLSLVAKLTLDTSAYEQGLSRAVTMAQNATKNIENAFNGVEDSTDDAGKNVEKFGSQVVKSGNTANSAMDSIMSKCKALAVAISAAFSVKKIVDFTGHIVSAYGEYEQLVGGVETLFGSAADGVIADAQNAFRTMQMSGRQYLTTSTSFAASLLKGIAQGQEAESKMTTEELSEMLSAQLEEREKALDDQYEAAKKSYDKSYDALQKSLDDEIEAYQAATEQKINQINKEYTERIKLIDEEKYNRIKAIDDQIKAIDDQAEAEEYATDKAEYEAKRAELADEAKNSKKRKNREQAQTKLEALEKSWNQKEKDRSRKQQVESLQEEKEAIKESYDQQKEQLKEEQNEKVNAVKESEKAQLKAMKEARNEQLRAVKESNAEQLKDIKERYDQEIALAKQAAQEQIRASEESSVEVGKYTDAQYQKARELSRMAVQDIADNANKMGTSMEMVMNAYMGLAKGNATMIDNLKVGYGGTQIEMLKLAKDMGVIDQNVKSFSQLSFDKSIEAIHELQVHLGIAGTSMKEGSETVEGSVNTMKAAWDNLITGMGDKNADVSALTDQFVETIVGGTDEAGNHVKGMLDNVIPVVSNAIKSIVTALPEIVDALSAEFPNAAGIFDKLKGLFKNISNFIGQVIGTVREKIGPVLQKLLPIIEKIVNILSDFIARIANSKLIMNSFADILGAVAKVAETLIAALGGILDYFKQNESILSGLIGSFIALKVAIEAYNIVMGIGQKAVAAWNMITKTATAVQTGLNAAMAANPIGLVIVAIGALVAAITLLWNNCEEFRNAIIYMFNEWQHGIELIGEWFFNVGQEIQAFWEGIPKFFENVWHGIQDAFSSVGEWFKDTFSKAWEGIKNVFSTTGQMFGNIGKSILNGLSSVINGIIWGINQVIKIPLDGLNGILRAIHDIDIFGLKPFDWIGQIPVPQIPSIPMLAEGGVLKRGQVALLEGQGDEAVIPLSQNTEWIDMVANRLNSRSGEEQPQNVYYTINIDVASLNANSREDIEQLADILLDVMAQKTARRKAAF